MHLLKRDSILFYDTPEGVKQHMEAMSSVFQKSIALVWQAADQVLYYRKLN